MAATQHYVWAVGHFVLLIASFRYLFATLLFRAISPVWYKLSYIGALVSYAIVCHKSLGTPQPNAAWIRRALNDENVQYFILALFWFSSRPIALTLLPYMIFSIFHVLTFVRTTIMPQFLPPGPPATQGGAPTPHPLVKKLQSWVKANYDGAMRAVAFAELVIFLQVIGGTLLLRYSLLSPIWFAHFLRQRYYHSAFTREAIATTIARLDGYVQQSQNPTVINIYTQAKAFIGKWAGTTYIERQDERR